MFQAVFLLIIAMCSIQSGASLAKNLFPILGAAGTSGLRLFFASMILLIIWRPWNHRFTRMQMKPLAFYGLSLGWMNLLFYYALERIPLGIAVALEFTGPLAVALFNSKKKVDFIWTILAGVGIYLLLPVSGAVGLDPLGVAFALGAGFFWAIYIFYGQKAGQGLHGGLATSMGMAFAAAVVLPFGIYSIGLKIFSPDLILLGLGVAILSSALPYSLEMISLKKLPTKTFGVLMSLEPAVGAFAGLLFLGEALTLLQWFAISCVIISSLGSTLTAK